MSHVRPDRLADLLRGKLSASRASDAQAHLAGCQSCRTALGRIEGAQAAMRGSLDAPLPDSSSVRATATLRWLRINPPRTVRPVFYGALGLAAAAAGLFLLWGRLATGPAQQGAPSVAVAPSPRPAPMQESIEALVTLLGGKVELLRGESRSPVEMGAMLRTGDRLNASAGARLAAQWGEGCGFLLEERAELTLSRLTASAQRFALARGKVDVKVQAGLAKADLEVETASHLVRVRGTWFTVAADGARTTVEVLEGVVEVAERDGSAVTVLQAPARGVFGPGRATTGQLSAARTAELRTRSELNLLPFSGLGALLKGSGVVLIASEPSGTIAVDGVEVGQTTLAIRRPLGRHFIEIARPGFVPVRRFVTVGHEPGELRTSLLPTAPTGLGDGPIAIEDMVRERSRPIRACYERSLKRDPSLAGTVTLQLHIGASGKVAQTAVESSTLAAPEVASCLEHEARTWRFATGRNATVVYPFVFRPQ